MTPFDDGVLDITIPCVCIGSVAGAMFESRKMPPVNRLYYSLASSPLPTKDKASAEEQIAEPCDRPP